ncbi:hypothetical protein PV328_008982 [Microctonus aethiopoides]|uniref:Bromo domain-containing protein n=1 Tax=Microctonus aethiopoides TaxID=144406 RepID=A0AA39FKQ1_9HYME|nr:hypothetical protein PV328_008982 [Microctonus aethiopoides]
MVYPPIANESTSRSSLEQSTQSSLFQSQSPVPSLLLPHHHHHQHQHQQHHHHHQQQQQHHHHNQQPQQHQQILYNPYNTIQTCIPPANQPQCIYPNPQRNPINSITLRSQESFHGVKNTKWKLRSLRVKEHQHNPNLQHPVPYPSAPPPSVILFDPIQTHLPTAPATPITSIYLNQSSTLFNHSGVYSNENYTNFSPNVISQPYYKPPEVQTYCLIDRSSSQNTFAHQQTVPLASTFYNASNTNVNHQNIKSFIAPSSNIYSSDINNDNRIIPNAVGPGKIYSNSLTSHALNLTNYSNDKFITNSSAELIGDLSIIKCPEKIFSDTDNRIISDNDRLFNDNNTDIDNEKLSTNNSNSIGIVKNQCDEKFSDESSNFDFTIEAEKMVSALCNTTSCELDKDEDKETGVFNIVDKKLSSPKNNNINDDEDKHCEKIDKSYKPWYFNDFSTEIKLSSKSIGTQTVDTFVDKTQCPELIKKTIYWGCNEADKILKNSPIISSRQSWLQNLSSATKIALTKSSTCFPVFSGDQIFSQDLINSLLRVGNGWLILDHYLNKQHHPNLNDKYDNDLIESFEKWQVSTNNLLENVIKTFINLEANNYFNDENISGNSTIINSSFPGDISLYVNYGLFGDPPAVTIPTPLTPAVESKSTNIFTRKSPYINNENRELKNRWSTGKESKLRTKWTITEHSRNTNEILEKNRSEKANWNSFSKDLPINQISQLINSIEPQKKLHCNFFSSQTNDGSNKPNELTNINSILNPETFPTDTNRQFWNPNIPSNSLYNFTYSDTSLNNSLNKINLLNQMGTDKTYSNESNTINLSAWFASMRNKRLPNVENTSSTWLTSTPSTAPIKFRETRNTVTSSSSASSSRMDTNRQIRTLKNMRTIQCAPWTANHLIDDHQNFKSNPDEYDSSEDVRVYMKPGSYNVPKKKNQSRRSQRREAAMAKHNQPNLLNNDETLYTSSNSLIISRSNISSSSSSPCSQDVQNKNATWKAACASAGLLLDALKARDNLKCNESDKIVNSTPKNSEKKKKNWKNFGDYDEKEHEINYEISKENSGSVELSSTDTISIIPRDDHQKSNIKTDSWLIRTLNNVTSETNKKEQHDQDETNDKLNILPWKKASVSDKKSEKHSFSLETSHTIAVMTLVDVVGKATYSETVRRFSSTTKPTSASKITQQKNGERGKIENNSLDTIDECKNEEQDEVMKQENTKIKSDKMIKLKKNKNSNDDRDWSVWYSSKRKQHNVSLGQTVLGKLESIHRTLWRMDVTRILKCPMTNVKVTSGDNSSPTESISTEHYRKIVKGPLCLETIGYKLKNHEYRKVEYVIRDFRKIIHNSKLNYKNDKDSIEKIENLSKKLEELLQQNFPDELLLHGRNCSPIINRKSPNRCIMSNNNPIINSSPSTTVICNGENEIALLCRKSTQTS